MLNVWDFCNALFSLSLPSLLLKNNKIEFWNSLSKVPGNILVFTLKVDSLVFLFFIFLQILQSQNFLPLKNFFIPWISGWQTLFFPLSFRNTLTSLLPGSQKPPSHSRLCFAHPTLRLPSNCRSVCLRGLLNSPLPSSPLPQWKTLAFLTLWPLCHHYWLYWPHPWSACFISYGENTGISNEINNPIIKASMVLHALSFHPSWACWNSFITPSFLTCDLHVIFLLLQSSC